MVAELQHYVAITGDKSSFIVPAVAGGIIVRARARPLCLQTKLDNAREECRERRIEKYTRRLSWHIILYRVSRSFAKINK